MLGMGFASATMNQVLCKCFQMIHLKLNIYNSHSVLFYSKSTILIDSLIVFCLINTLHVALRLFSNRLQMISKCGKNKIVAYEVIVECITDDLTPF